MALVEERDYLVAFLEACYFLAGCHYFTGSVTAWDDAILLWEGIFALWILFSLWDADETEHEERTSGMMRSRKFSEAAWNLTRTS